MAAGCGDDGPFILPRQTGTGEARVGPEGGVVQTDDANARAVVPPGALELPTLIRIRRLPPDSIPPALAARQRVSETYRFEPDGLAFRNPVEVQIFFDAEELPEGVSLEDLTIGKLSNNRNLEELTGIRILEPPSEGRARLQVTRRGVGGQASGFSPFAVWVADSSEPARDRARAPGRGP